MKRTPSAQAGALCISAALHEVTSPPDSPQGVVLMPSRSFLTLTDPKPLPTAAGVGLYLGSLSNSASMVCFPAVHLRQGGFYLGQFCGRY